MLPNRIVLRCDGVEDGRCDPHGVGADNRFDFFFIKAEPFGQVLGLHDALGQDLSPIFHESSFVDQLIRHEGWSSSWLGASGVVRACD